MSVMLKQWGKAAVNGALGKLGYAVLSQNYLNALKRENDILYIENVEQKKKLDSLEVETAEQKRKLDALKLPSIHLCAQPKSAGFYLYHKIAATLNLQKTQVCEPVFPESLYSTSFFDNFKNGNMIAHSHLKQIHINLAAILHFTKKSILHIRDPRQSCVSWIYFMNHLNTSEHLGKYNLQNRVYMGDVWMRSSFNDKFEITVNFFYKEIVDWLKTWFSVLEIDFKKSFKQVHMLLGTSLGIKNPKFFWCNPLITEVLITKYEDMIMEESVFIDTILDFYQIPKFLSNKIELKKDHSIHFRTGRTDSWKTELTPEQQERVTALLPKEWIRYFGWE